MGKRIVIVGGGSSRWGPKLMADLLLTPSLAGSTYILHDLNAANADRVARFARRLADELKVAATIEAEVDPERALAGADYIIVTIAVGGYQAMAPDLDIPQEYGIYQIVADTLGPAGWARTLRNAAVFVELAQRIRRLAPAAAIVNYCNPMAQLTKILCLHTAQPVIGLCYGMAETLHFLQLALGLESVRDMHIAFAGVNHLFWITSLIVRGQDGYRLLRERRGQGTLADLMARVLPGRYGGYVAEELFRITGMLTYISDKHVAEFFPQYLTSRERMAAYHLELSSVAERVERMRQAEAQLEAMTSGEISDVYHHPSGEAAAGVIDAMVTGAPLVEVGNVPNVGQVSNLPLGSVLETPVLVTPGGFRPVAVGGLPEPARSWVERATRVEDMTTEAALAGDVQLALAALALDPLCSHLSWPQVEEMGLRLLRANARFMPQFAGRL